MRNPRKSWPGGAVDNVPMFNAANIAEVEKQFTPAGGDAKPRLTLEQIEARASQHEDAVALLAADEMLAANGYAYIGALCACPDGGEAGHRLTCGYGDLEPRTTIPGFTYEAHQLSAGKIPSEMEVLRGIRGGVGIGGDPGWIETTVRLHERGLIELTDDDEDCRLTAAGEAYLNSQAGEDW